MTSVKLKLNKDRILLNGTYPLVFQVIHRRRKKLIYSRFKVAEPDYDAGQEKVVYRKDGLTHREVRIINRWITKERKKLNSLIGELKESMPDFTVSDITGHYEGSVKGEGLFAFIDGCIRQKEELNRLGTAAAYRSTRSSLLHFTGKEKVAVSEVNAAFVRAYEKYLLKSGVCRNTVSFYMRNLRAVYNQAILDGKMESSANPFQHAQTRPAKTVKRAMSRDHIRRLMQLPLEDAPELDFVRNLFMFSFYARGMSFVDMVFLKKENIKCNFIEYYRHKTQQLIRVSLTDQLKDIISHYRNDTDYIFPVIDDSSGLSPYRQYRLALGKAERRLKQLGQRLGYEVELTTYVARHSWATQAKECGIPVSVISEGLGHTSEKTTRIYLKEFDQKVLDECDQLVAQLVEM